MFSWHRGQSRFSPDAASLRLGSAPQCEQNFSPTNIIPKHDGQATVAKRALQYSQCVAPVEAEAPQDGHFSVSAGINLDLQYLKLFCSKNNCGGVITPLKL